MPQVFLSTRRGAWILNRVGKHGYPIDLLLSSRIMYYLSRICGPSLKNNYMEKQMNQRFDHEMFGLKPKHRYVSRMGVWGGGGGDGQGPKTRATDMGS